MGLAFFFLFITQAKAYFENDFFVRHELVRQGILSTPAVFKAGEQYIFSDCCVSPKTVLIKILNVDQKEVHYLETHTDKVGSVEKIEGWINSESGQLNKYIVNGKALPIDPQEAIDVKIDKQISIATPVGTVRAVKVYSNRDILFSEWTVSEQVPGNGIVYLYQQVITSSSSTKWIDYSP